MAKKSKKPEDLTFPAHWVLACFDLANQITGMAFLPVWLNRKSAPTDFKCMCRMTTSALLKTFGSASASQVGRLLLGNYYGAAS